MKPMKLVLVTTMVLCLTLVVSAQLPQKDQPQPNQRQVDQDRTEAAHSELLTGQDKAAEASRLTQAVASALPGAAASSAPIPRKNFIDEHVFGRIERDNIPRCDGRREGRSFGSCESHIGESAGFCPNRRADTILSMVASGRVTCHRDWTKYSGIPCHSGRF